MNKLRRDCAGSSLVEFTLIFPILILVALGTIDVGFLLFDWAQANKAAYVGAHRAIVLDPVATDIRNITYPAGAIAGQPCYVPATGALDTNNCPSVQSTCTPAAGGGGSCTNSYVFNDTATGFQNIFNSMQAIFPRLRRENVRISYAITGLGFVSRPGGLPMNVTVTITGMTHQLFFIGPIMNFFGGGFGMTPPIPPFATTLVSESMITSQP